MKLFWHFLSSNIRYNKLELAISYGLTILFHFAYTYVQSINVIKAKKTGESAEIFVSVAFYATLYVYYTNKRKTHIKYYLSLPISKAKLLLNKVFSEFVFFIPAIYLLNMGAYYYKLEIHHIALTFILMQVGVLVSLFLFDSAVEEPRLENAKASFMNRLVYVRKTMDFLFRFVAIAYLGAAIYILQIETIFKEYMVIILLGVVIFFKFQNSLRLIKDESLSYFISKRDLVRAGWKFGIVLVPVLAFKPASDYLSAYGDHKVIEYIINNDQEKVAQYYQEHQSWDLKLKNNFTPTLVAIRHGNVEVLDYLVKTGAPIPGDNAVQGFGVHGMKAAHLAFLSKSPDMVAYLGEKYPELLAGQTNTEKKTALHMAVDTCDGKMIDALLETPVNLNIQNLDGETAIVSAAKNKCYYGILALANKSADVTIMDEKGDGVFDYLKNNSFRYLIEKKYPHQFQRYLASIVPVSAEEQAKSPEQPSQQKR